MVEDVNHLPATLSNTYLGLRHGESEANKAGIVLSKPAAGIPFSGLTPVGREQVRNQLAASGLGPDTRVISSDFRRARESAEIACEVLSAAPLTLEAGLRERLFGEWEGKPNSAYDEVWAVDADDPHHTRWGVESAAAVTARLTRVVAALEAQHTGATILLVAHGDPLQLLQTAFAGLDPATHRQRPHWAPGEVRPLTRA